MKELWGMKKRAVPVGALFFALCAVGCSQKGEDIPSERDLTKARIDSLNALIRNDPDNPALYVARGKEWQSLGNPKEALTDFDYAIAADSSFAEGWVEKINVLYAMQDLEGCVAAADGCIAHAPEATACLLKRAEFHIHLRQYEQAFERLNAALQLDDQLEEAYWMKGKIYRENGNSELALSSFATSVEVNPEFFDGYIALGLQLAEAKDPAAIDAYRSAADLRPKSIEPRYNLAMYLQESGRFDEASAAYYDILALDSNNATACFNLGYIRLEYLQQYDSAAYWFSEAIQRLPYYHQAWFNRGLALESLGREQDALRDYNEALRIKPDYTAAAKAKGRLVD
jgi:tetratricopeptide (TPR) repeat protein